MAGTRLISIVGKPGAGKTTLIVALAAEFTRQGHTVGSIAATPDASPPGIDQTDPWHHVAQGTVSRGLLLTPKYRIVIERAAEGENDLDSLVRRYFRGMDLVIVEGIESAALPKIEVHRKKVHQTPLYGPSVPDPQSWVAMVTDDPTLRVPFPTFRFNDTAWLVTLTGLSWGSARLVEL